MIKKIKKYLKFTICLMLIIGLLAPSYAAIPASDGSTLVTKAEFDSVLTDFNAKLTTFEAGINSKIDSQVTSYLDRNGIWSGKDQEWLIDIGERKNVLPDRRYWVPIATSATNDKITIPNGHHLEALPFNKKIAKASKTGMCTLVWGYKAGNGTLMNYNRAHISGGSAKMCSILLEAGINSDTFTLSLSPGTSGSDMKTSTTESVKDVLWCTMVSGCGSSVSAISVPYGSGTIYTAQFFVNTNDDIWARVRVYIDAGDGAIAIEPSYSYLMEKTESYRPEIVFKSCKIY